MKHTRRSRMNRQATGKRLQLTARDIELFKLLYRYPYLRSNFLYAFLGGASETRFKERLGHLYHEGSYVERPQQQWQFANSRYMPVIYELADAGEQVLRELGLLCADGPLVRRSRTGVHRQFGHSLMIAEILASIELGVRRDENLRFVSWQEILATAPEKTRSADNPFAMPVSVSYRSPRTGSVRQVSMHLVPDALFGLEYVREGKRTYRFFALEADRGTMPLRRSNLEQSSYLRKILAYKEILERGIHRSHFGLPNLLVLNVTTNARHMSNTTALVQEVTNGSPVFLFKAVPRFDNPVEASAPVSDMLTGPWQRSGAEAFQIDR